MAPHFTLFTNAGPNPIKVHTILFELGLEHDYKFVNNFKGEQKLPAYTKYCVNGRVPALIDHQNNDFVLWESGAIILYLIEKYDKDHKISFAKLEEHFEAVQWLMFQVSGQGPYWGQMVWFRLNHPEKVPSAVERYNNEIKRCMTVLETALEGKEWLVGGKLSFADISLMQWMAMLDMERFMGDDFESWKNWRNEWPRVGAWHAKITARESFQKARALQAEFMAKA